jgi:hypothetical protein
MRRIVGALALSAMFAWSPPAFAQSAPVKYLSGNSTNATLVHTGNSLLKTAIVVNTTTTVYYLKLYNKATAPICGTDIPKWNVPIPVGANSTIGGFVLPLADGLQFPLGFGFCLTGALADNDTTPAVAGIAINLGVSGR